MKKILIIIIILFTILISGCVGNLLSGGVNINSEPEGASVYIDSEFKGETPCIVNNLPAGNHIIQLRHNKYPNWEKDINIEIGQDLDILADLSENIIPKISLACDGSGTYAIGDVLLLSGTAETADDFVEMQVKQYSGDYPYYFETYNIPIDDDFLYEYSLSTNGMSSGKYWVTASLSTGESINKQIIIQSTSQTNTEIVQKIVEDYHKTHTYSYSDFFVCADMALDVWNMVETQGINAKIAVGDVQRSNEEFFETNHAWVLAEVSPGSWLALEPTGGYTVPDNQQYYNGWFFESAREFKACISLKEQYNAQLIEIKDAETRYNLKVSEYNSQVAYLENLINTYNSYFAGQYLTSAESQAAGDLMAKIIIQKNVVSQVTGELNQATTDLNNEYSTLQGIVEQMMRQID